MSIEGFERAAASCDEPRAPDRRGPIYLTLVGDLDARSAPELIAGFSPVRGAELVTDLTGVEFIDAAGLGALIALRNDCDAMDCELHLVGASPNVARVFALGRVQGLLREVDEARRVLDDLAVAVVAAVSAASVPAQPRFVTAEPAREPRPG